MSDECIGKLDFAIHLAGERYAKHRGTVPIETLADVLKHIGKHPECYESLSRICLTLKISIRTLSRAMAVLRDLKILKTERRRKIICHRINLEHVRQLVEQQTYPDNESEPKQ